MRSDTVVALDLSNASDTDGRTDERTDKAFYGLATLLKMRMGSKWKGGEKRAYVNYLSRCSITKI